MMVSPGKMVFPMKKRGFAKMVTYQQLKIEMGCPKPSFSTPKSAFWIYPLSPGAVGCRAQTENARVVCIRSCVDRKVGWFMVAIFYHSPSNYWYA